MGDLDELECFVKSYASEKLAFFARAGDISKTVESRTSRVRIEWGFLARPRGFHSPTDFRWPHVHL